MHTVLVMRSNFRILVAVFFSLWICGTVSAQSKSENDEFERYARRMNKQFNDARDAYNTQYEAYRNKINRQFASYLEKEWKKITLLDPVQSPLMPEPEFEKPSDDNRLLPSRVPTVEPVDVVPPKPIIPFKSKPVVPINLLPDNPRIVVVPDDVIVEEPQEPQKPDVTPEHSVSFMYLANNVQVRVPSDAADRISLGNYKSGELSKAWNKLSGENYNSMLVDCICLRESLQLCDWAFYQFLLEFTKAYYGNEKSSEAVLTQAYVLSQFGYKVRLASCNSQLHVLIAYTDEIYAVPYFIVDGIKFYAFTIPSSTSIQFCDFKFPGEKASSAALNSLPVVPAANTAKKTFRSKRFENLSADIVANKNLIGFYDSYPSCRWDIKAKASLSKNIKDQLYPVLKKVIKDKSEEEAANILINFVQTAFEYMTDDKQFGCEKAFFGDELFFYPYSDCEDRSVLYAILVRELLNLDVVLLEYPTHLATAVKFNDGVTGDHFIIDGKKYVVCDPTYIGASIGESMPSMRNVQATVIRVK